MQDLHLDAPTMISALKYVRPNYRRVHLTDCRLCGAPVIIAGVQLRQYDHLLPPSPTHTGWRAFDRAWVESPDAWRSSKRYGFIPSKYGAGFLPHVCPKADA